METKHSEELSKFCPRSYESVMVRAEMDSQI